MKLGIIGGSGLYDIDCVKKIKLIDIETPFGSPSGKFLLGEINNTEIYFLPRHGNGHTLNPSEVNHRANIYGMKKLGVTHILAVSAVGSLQKNLIPKDIVFVDQYFDRTKKNHEHTFFNDGIVGHIPFGDPICKDFSKMVFEQAEDAIKELYSADQNPPKAVKRGTYVNMEGPAFSTKAESNLYRSWGMDIIGMTSLGEAKLSREAGICYCVAAMVTDFDCWHPDHDNVSVDVVFKTMETNINTAKCLIEKTVNAFNHLERKCSCKDAGKNSIMTSPSFITEEVKKRLAPIVQL